MKKLLFVEVFFFTSICLPRTILYKKGIFLLKTMTLCLTGFCSLNFDPHKKYPLILFLHGSGERGNDNEKQLMHGAIFF